MIDSSRICPWWLAPALDNQIRRLIHNPEKILGGYIESGQRVLDVGCRSGTFTILKGLLLIQIIPKLFVFSSKLAYLLDKLTSWFEIRFIDKSIFN